MEYNLLSTTYLGNIYYYSILARNKKNIIEKNENFIKQTFRNRCSIYSANGQLDLTIPIVKKTGKKILISDIEICYDTAWYKLHWNSIISAYNSSPFFEYFRDDFEALYMKKPHLLFDFNLELMKLCLDILQISVSIQPSDSFLPISDNNENDFRYKISPKLKLPKANFRNYYQVFEEKHGFIPNLSIIDLIFNEGPDALTYLKSV